MGGGGGGAGPYFDVSPYELRKKAEESSQALQEGFRPQLEELLAEKLASFEGRDRDLTNQRRDSIREALRDLLDTTWDLPFGGSVAKHTEVTGISDVDALLVMRDGNADDVSPEAVRTSVAHELRRTLTDAEVTTGRMAVTVEYPDGMEIQLIPAVRAGRGYKVPSRSGDNWSRIDPRKFSEALSRHNDRCNGKLVPVIKLAKSIISTWPDSVRLSGYHIESLAIDVFRGYGGRKTVGHMLPTFFEKAAGSVLTPTKDSTGQSVHVDAYMNRSHSPKRKKASHWLSQTAKRMRQASLQGSTAQWQELFE